MESDPDAEKADFKYSDLLYSISLEDGYLVMSRRFPPLSHEIKYGDIVSVEHKRLIEYSLFAWFFICMAVTYAFISIPALQGIVAAVLQEIKTATGATVIDTASAIMWITAIFIVIAAYYFIRFMASLIYQTAIYRSGKNPVAMPMPLNGTTMRILMELNRRVKEAGGMSKMEVKRMITEEIRGLLDERARMQEELIESMKKEFESAKTDADKMRAKKKLREGVEKLKSQDEIIDRELKKTGFTKDEVFKKYRIKEPDEAFIEDLLKGVI